MEKITYDYAFRIPSPKFYEYYINFDIHHLSCNRCWDIPMINLSSKRSINSTNVGNIGFDKKLYTKIPKRVILETTLFVTHTFKYLYILLYSFTSHHMYFKIELILLKIKGGNRWYRLPFNTNIFHDKDSFLFLFIRIVFITQSHLPFHF